MPRKAIRHAHVPLWAPEDRGEHQARRGESLALQNVQKRKGPLAMGTRPDAPPQALGTLLRLVQYATARRMCEAMPARDERTRGRQAVRVRLRVVGELAQDALQRRSGVLGYLDW
jgi:hypothetical protein